MNWSTHRLRNMLLHSIVYVLDIVVKTVLTQQDVGCNARGTCIVKTQEYDIEIKHTELVSSNSLCKAIVENKVIEESKESGENKLVLAVGLHDMWFEDIAYFLTYGEWLEDLTARQ